MDKNYKLQVVNLHKAYLCKYCNIQNNDVVRGEGKISYHRLVVAKILS